MFVFECMVISFQEVMSRLLFAERYCILSDVYIVFGEGVV